MNPILKFAIIAAVNYVLVPMTDFVDLTLVQSLVIAAIVVAYSEALHKPAEVILVQTKEKSLDKETEETE
jgi:hypothetical protein